MSDRSNVPGQAWENWKLFFAGRITATSSGAAQTLYTAPSDTDPHTGVKVQRIKLQSIRMMNIDTTARRLTLYIVPAGASISDDYIIMPACLCPDRTLWHEVGVDEYIMPGDTVQAYASATNTIVVRLTGLIRE